MPSTTQGAEDVVPKLGSNSITSRGRFELPVLAPLDSLTAGTSIPPPIPSPLSSTTDLDLTLHLTKTRDFAPVPTAKDRQNRIIAQNNSAGYIGVFGVRGSTVAPASSPTSPGRPSSIRRFLSRKSLNQNYNENGAATEKLSDDSRPESPSTFSTISARPSVSSKRNSSWFSRFIGGSDGGRESKRQSVVYENPQANMPPPPQLPKLEQLDTGVTGNSLSMDAEKMFKNI